MVEQERCLQNTCRAPSALPALDMHRKIWKPFLAHFPYTSVLLPALPAKKQSSSDKSSRLKAIPTLLTKLLYDIKKKQGEKKKESCFGHRFFNRRFITIAI